MTLHGLIGVERSGLGFVKYTHLTLLVGQNLLCDIYIYINIYIYIYIYILLNVILLLCTGRRKSAVKEICKWGINNWLTRSCEQHVRNPAILQLRLVSQLLHCTRITCLMCRFGETHMRG
jgi:hypothetical protein